MKRSGMKGGQGRAGQGGAGAEEAKKETRLLARFASSGSGFSRLFSVLVYISLTGALTARLAPRPAVASLWLLPPAYEKQVQQ